MQWKRITAFTGLTILINSVMYAQSAQTLSVRAYREQHEVQWFPSFLSFLSIPNTANTPEGLTRCAAFICDRMHASNLEKVQLLQADKPGVPPAVYGEYNIPGATKTITFYAHYDGQPVDSTQWLKGLHPFRPVLATGSIEKNAAVIPLSKNLPLQPDWRIYARGSSDDKAGVMAIIDALDAVKSGKYPLHYNLHFFFEGEEEKGSANLGDIFQKYKSLLKSDLWIICDGPLHPSGYKQVSFGVRGDAHIAITTYGANRPLHSGHYGNWAPNPAWELVQLLATMKDSSGKVTINGFYDDTIPLTSEERTAINAAPPVTTQLMKELAIAREETAGLDLPEAILQPSLNINGIESGHVGSKASNVIPTTASVVLDLRLVPGNDYKRQQDKIIAHIRKQGYYVVDHDPTIEERLTHARVVKVIPDEGYNAQRTSMELPEAKKVISAVRSTTGDHAVVPVISMGGSLPLYLFDVILKVPVITVSIANHDNNQHAENENIRIGNFWSGIESLAAIMSMQ